MQKYILLTKLIATRSLGALPTIAREATRPNRNHSNGTDQKHLSKCIAVQWANATIGRQTLAYGDERLIGTSDWNNFGRTFDARGIPAWLMLPASAKARMQHRWRTCNAPRFVRIDSPSLNGRPNFVEKFASIGLAYCRIVGALTKKLCHSQN